ncbi:MAG: zinc ABC transporter substrate-binding protein [Desulfobacteraceae bacterium]|nr:zinc ABC transporter substrate-binding protein [Desulfobacteraceae bacterium]
MKRFYTAVAIVLLLAAGAQVKAENSSTRLNVFVSILPQKYFVKQIAGNHADIRTMVSPGAHPATYEPSASHMAALAECDIYFAVGVPFEQAWMKKIRGANPGIKVVYTDNWIEKQPIDRTSDSLHSHGGGDPHIWLSPPLVMVQARHILTALIKADPKHAQIYKSGYNEFIAELAELDTELHDFFPPEKDPKEFIVLHPSWGYFADAYGLKQTAVEAEGKSPKAGKIRKLIELARLKGIKTVLVQPQISGRTAEMIARAIDGTTVTADPLAEDWRKNLLEVARKISRAAR